MAGAGLLSALREEALSQGFSQASGVDWALARTEYAQHSARYEDWIARGFAGQMPYLVRGLDRRKNPELVFPELKSIFCVTLPYRQSPLGHLDPTQGPRYARYLDGPDYHDRISSKLTQTLERVRARPGFSTLTWKVCVDTSAVLERTWGSLTGLGWLGKNTLLIHPKWGSRFFIGVAFLNAELGQGIQKLPDYCGNCSRCLEGCPTQAFEQPHLLDSRRCISYWTLEKRGELELTPTQEKAIGTWVAGCDTCQDVCPFNTKPERLLGDPEVDRPSEDPYALTWEQLENESDDGYTRRTRGSALERVKPAMRKRNLEMAIKNSGRPVEDLDRRS